MYTLFFCFFHMIAIKTTRRLPTSGGNFENNFNINRGFFSSYCYLIKSSSNNMTSKKTTEGPLAGGLKAFNIQGRLYRERERLRTVMTAEERCWRQQWVRDQHLAPDEPLFVLQNYKELNNPIRRAYRLPLDTIFSALQPVIGKEFAIASRAVIGKLIMIFTGLYIGTYYFKYNPNSWTRKGGWRVITSRPKYLPGEAGYQSPPERNVGADYASRGFKDSPI